MNDLTQERLERALGPWAPEVRYLDEVDSTNRLAMEWARLGAPEGCVVVAGHQTAGRGRLGRTWVDVPGGALLFSVILRPRGVASDVGLINLTAAVAVARTLRDAGLEAGVKWPNDVMLGGRKAAGILSEMELAPGATTSVVLGVGINVNLAPGDLPEELRELATSLSAEAGRRFDRVDLLAGFLGHFGGLYVASGERRPYAVLEHYRPLCETLGRRVRVLTPEGGLEGVAVDLDPWGGLVLDSGEVVRAGDVVHLR